MTDRKQTKINHHNSLYHSEKNPIPGPVFKQELVTWEQTEYGLVRTILIRDFTPHSHLDSYVPTGSFETLEPNAAGGQTNELKHDK